MTNAALRGKPDAGNPHVAPTPGYGGAGRFDEGKVAPAKPRRGSLLYKRTSLICLAFALAGTSLLAAAANVPRIIFDTDMFEDYDDVGALAVLHKLADKGRCEILATVTSTRDNQSVAMCEVLNTYFGRPEIPVGAPAAPAVNRPSSRSYRAVVEKYAKCCSEENASSPAIAAMEYSLCFSIRLAAAMRQSRT